jgi:integrase/recombinase XerC
MRRWDRLVDQYMEGYEAAGRFAEAIKGMRRELERWGSWLKNRRPRPALEEVDAELIVGYLRMRGAWRAKATLSGVMSKLRCMGEFLMREGLWRSNPLRWLRGPKLDIRSHLPRRISAEVMRGLWEAAAKHRYSYHRGLWLALLSVFYGTGMRRGDVCRLKVSDWRREEGLLLVRNHKTGQERQVPVPAVTWQCLEAYLPKRQNHLEALGHRDETALFVDRSGSRLSASAISRGMKHLAGGCSQTPITLHQFRHTCASDLLEAGVCLPDVQQLLGHQSIGTTMRYLHVADPQLHQAVKLHPLNDTLALGGVA